MSKNERDCVGSLFCFADIWQITVLTERLRSFRTQAGWKRISRKRGQGIRKLTPKNVRVHRESALHLALSKEWISRTSLTAPKLFAS